METNSQEGGSPGRTSQMLLQMMSQMSEQLLNLQNNQQTLQQSLKAEREADREEIRTHQEQTRVQIQALQSAIATPAHTSIDGIANPTPRRQEPIPSVLNTQLTSPPIPTESQQQNIIYIKKKPTLPDPKLFDGNRRNFQVWQLEMESKLRVDGPALGNSADQFAYIYTRLDQTPQSLAAAYFKKGGSNGSHNPVEFMAYLVSCYGDRHLKQKALNRLETMRQNNKESFAAFLPRFERELADSGGYNWDDEIKINSLRRVINQEMEGHLISQLALPTVYPDFVNTLQSLGANIEGYHFRNHKLRYQSSYQQNPYPKESNSNYHPNQPRREQPQQNNQSATGSNQMDWEPTKAGKLRSNKQRKQPKYAPECYNCGNLGHIARYCKTNRKGKQESQPETRIAKGKSKKTLSREEDDDLGGSDDSNSEYESGNE
ncbi:hypothetical protein VHEMI07185 [[Torrubiella] hemipterigena]|uniref:CCHC-type domain-containing protein n=1 Tax=[Torrubiella] hemipterigena TaxID=1531966 RepID=A0A0A1TKW8_9HYPO|nr:hypothetical protein VHEMI07185 [[Torrubiella] hemipterigena]